MDATVAERTAAFDRILSATRAVLRGQNLREVLCAVRVDAVAIEPYIEPIQSGDKLLITSPELALKQLVARGGGDVFTIAACHREGERGDLHAPGFHLVEWYRGGENGSRMRADVEAIIAAAFEAMHRPAPLWETFGFLDLVESLTDVALVGDESADELVARLGGRVDLLPKTPTSDDAEVARLLAWTSFMTHVCDGAIDPFLRKRGGGAHVVDFPIVLGALARAGQPGEEQGPTRQGPHAFAHRFESYVGGVELANGYLELTDPDAQTTRFETVAGLRHALGQPKLPWPSAFLQALRSPGLPPCSGVALGFERLVMLASGATTLAQINPFH